MNELVSFTLNDGIAVITLNNGKVNALSPAVLAALNAALDRAQEAGAMVVLTGQPGILSGGYDLKVMMQWPEQANALVTAGSMLTRRMLAHPQPIIEPNSRLSTAARAVAWMGCVGPAAADAGTSRSRLTNSPLMG